MSTSSQTKISVLYTSILYFLGFFLFMEWLYPLAKIGDTTDLFVFIVYAVFCFAVSALPIKWWLSFLLKGFAMLFAIDRLFISYAFPTKGWFQYLFADMGFNLNALFSQNWYELTPLFRSFMFLLLIWLMSYLLHYWFIVMKRIFLFVLLTIIYLAVLDTFTVYEADAAIVRTFIVSFIALGMASLFKEFDRESIRLARLKKTSVWILPLIAVVLFSTIVGYAAPKFDPQWPDPVPFLTSTAEGSGVSGNGNVIGKVGYGEDDSRLGGSFLQDYTPVFQAVAKEKQYWRIDSKDVYTGKGWERSSNSETVLQENGNITFETFSDQVETTERETTLKFQGNTTIEKLIYPYGIRQVQAGDAQLVLDDEFGGIRTQWNNKNTSLSEYTIQYDMPSFSIDKLREANATDPKTIKQQYTQLPSELPARIGELAREITASEDNRYDKAKAIEQYFGLNGFRYETQGVPVPGPGQDYVDQFLFESKIGYCDNYSTSMVVMLRTLGIPARWVKGFTGGEKIAEDVGGADGDYDLYEVKNSNAHSWVEVYFPETGWVPFEPTQGFTNFTDFQIDTDSALQDETTAPPEQQDQTPPQQKDETEQVKENDTKTPTETSDAFNFTVKWWYIAIAATVLLIIAIVIYRTRFRWKTSIMAAKFKKENTAKTYQDAYHHLLKLLKHNGLEMEPDQTLREFAKRIDTRYGTDEMGRLTEYYERMLYRNEINDSEAGKLSELWKNLIKRIMA